jgi:hypothetical protein
MGGEFESWYRGGGEILEMFGGVYEGGRRTKTKTKTKTSQSTIRSKWMRQTIDANEVR